MDFKNFNDGLNYICSETNFIFCRIAEALENNGCPVNYYHVGGDYILSDVLFLIFGAIIAILSLFLVSAFKGEKLIYHKQRAPRGLLYIRTHVFFRGLYLLFWVLSMCVTAKFDDTHRVMIGIRACLLNISQTILIFMGLTDMQLYPYQYRWMHIITIIVSLVVGLSIFLQWLDNGKSAAGIIFLGFVWHFGAQLFYFFGCIPVCIVRRLWKCLVYLISFTIVEVASIFIELYVNGPLCRATDGYLTAPFICAFLQIIYIVLFIYYFHDLKRNEVMDGLKSRPRRLSETPSSELNKPLAIAFSDYTYSYTYTEDESDQDI